MARIRSIKPEFWTDETMVRMPFEARLLFIGLWNFADDYGCFADEPERLRMQILPGDGVDIVVLLDLLAAAGRIELNESPDGGRFWTIAHFSDHQKVDKPGKASFPERARAKKLAIPQGVRRAVAKKYGCGPGEEKTVGCFYCGEEGLIRWWQLPSGKPSFWVSFGLELDHFTPEAHAGPATAENIVLACRQCNRRKLTTDALEFLSRSLGPFPRDSPSPREPSRVVATEGKGGEGKGVERKGGEPAPPPPPDAVAAPGALAVASVAQGAVPDRRTSPNGEPGDLQNQMGRAWFDKHGVPFDWPMDEQRAIGPALGKAGGDEAEVLRRWRNALLYESFPVCGGAKDLVRHWNTYGKPPPSRAGGARVVQAGDRGPVGDRSAS